MNNSIATLTPQQLRRAAGLKEKIASLEKELGRIVGASASASAAKPGRRKKRRLSAAGRARIAAAARARWARARAGKK